MKKFFRESIVFLCALIVAVVIIIPITLYVIHRTGSDTFNGNVAKIPIDISSPSYGVIQSIPVTEGSTVVKGQTLATVQVLDPTFKFQATDNLYSMQDKILTIHSPVNGVLGKITLARQSTIDVSQTLMQLYTLDNITIQIFLPQEKNLSDYDALSVEDPSNGTKYPLQVLGQIPLDSIPESAIPLDPNTNIPVVLKTAYRATCVYATDCQKMLYSESVTINAKKKQIQFLGYNIPSS